MYNCSIAPFFTQLDVSSQLGTCKEANDDLQYMMQAIPALNVVFSATYYLESCNIIFVYCTFHILSTYVKLVVWIL